MKASEVLQASIDDIEAGKWVCNLLHEKDYEGNSPNPKEMGCAVGLVSLNSGDTKTVKIQKKHIPYFYGLEEPSSVEGSFELNIESGPNAGASCSINKEVIKVGDTFEVARYPKSGSPKETKDAIKYLYQEIPEDLRYEDFDSKKNSLQLHTNAVVNYNDRDVKHLGAAGAKKWFEAARDRALADGN